MSCSLATSTLRFLPPRSLRFCFYFPFHQCLQPNSNLSVSFCCTFDGPPLLSFVLALLPRLFSLRIFFTSCIFSCRSKSGLRPAALVEEDGSGEQNALSLIVSTPKEDSCSSDIIRIADLSTCIQGKSNKFYVKRAKRVSRLLKYSLKINWERSFMYRREVP